MPQARAGVDKSWFTTRMKERGLTVRSMADRLNIHFSAVSRTLNGERRMKTSEVRKVAQMLNEPESEVLARLDPQTPAASYGRPESGDSPRSVSAGQKATAGDTDSFPPHPVFERMKGLIVPVGDVDPTQPADPDWGRVYE